MTEINAARVAINLTGLKMKSTTQLETAIESLLRAGLAHVDDVKISVAVVKSSEVSDKD